MRRRTVARATVLPDAVRVTATLLGTPAGRKK